MLEILRRWWLEKADVLRNTVAIGMSISGTHLQSMLVGVVGRIHNNRVEIGVDVRC